MSGTGQVEARSTVGRLLARTEAERHSELRRLQLEFRRLPPMEEVGDVAGDATRRLQILARRGWADAMRGAQEFVSRIPQMPAFMWSEVVTDLEERLQEARGMPVRERHEMRYGPDRATWERKRRG